jgi:hypothetical protein
MKDLTQSKSASHAACAHPSPIITFHYFFGSDCDAGTSDSTDRCALECDSTTVSAIEVSMKMIAE